ncbi:MAG: hypothetical protein WBD74_00580 [Candidatus Aquilonibacter sp.]
MAPPANPGTFLSCMHTKFLAALAALAFFAPLAAAAQDAPSYAQPNVQQVADDQQIQGRISNFDGGYNLTVQDDRGFVDTVQLHDGTIINPTGLTLAPGMVVSILGYNAGPYFAANEVDTPYTFNGGMPYYAGHPWNYYGPTISLGFFFGNTGWWHGSYFAPVRYHYVGNARVYDNVRVTNVYRGGTFRGRTYVAPASRGGYYPHGQARRDGRPPRY